MLSPYSAYPGVQRTLNKVRQPFSWKGQTGDVRNSVDSWETTHTEKSDHSLSTGQLQSPAFPVQKWKEVSIDYITGLPDVEDINSVMAVIDKATRLTRLIARSKSVTAVQSV